MIRFSKFTVALGLWIIISASFMRQVWEFMQKILGKGNANTFVIFLFLILTTIALIHIIKINLGIFRIAASLAVISLAFIFAWQQPYPSEKIHVLEYGLLGWLATRDLDKSKKAVATIFWAVLFVSIAGALDEAFQWILPYRTGEFRDVMTNIISGAFGILLFLFE